MTKREKRMPKSVDFFLQRLREALAVEECTVKKTGVDTYRIYTPPGFIYKISFYEEGHYLPEWINTEGLEKKVIYYWQYRIKLHINHCLNSPL